MALRDCFGRLKPSRKINMSMYFFQQMKFFKNFYLKFQDFLLMLRSTRKEKAKVTTELLDDWEDDLHDLDKIFREKLFILCIAAEKGWKIAGEVAFLKKGIY